jgi:hypothetical protein
MPLFRCWQLGFWRFGVLQISLLCMKCLSTALNSWLNNIQFGWISVGTAQHGKTVPSFVRANETFTIHLFSLHMLRWQLEHTGVFLTHIQSLLLQIQSGFGIHTCPFISMFFAGWWVMWPGFPGAEHSPILGDQIGRIFARWGLFALVKCSHLRSPPWVNTI